MNKLWPPAAYVELLAKVIWGGEWKEAMRTPMETAIGGQDVSRGAFFKECGWLVIDFILPWPKSTHTTPQLKVPRPSSGLTNLIDFLPGQFVNVEWDSVAKLIVKTTRAQGLEDSKLFSYVQLYTIPEKPFICIECPE